MCWPRIGDTDDTEGMNTHQCDSMIYYPCSSVTSVAFFRFSHLLYVPPPPSAGGRFGVIVLIKSLAFLISSGVWASLLAIFAQL